VPANQHFRTSLEFDEGRQSFFVHGFEVSEFEKVEANLMDSSGSLFKVSQPCQSLFFRFKKSTFCKFESYFLLDKPGFSVPLFCHEV
jgi:hypothetical protein